MVKQKLEEAISSRSARRDLYFLPQNGHTREFVAVFLCLTILPSKLTNRLWLQIAALMFIDL